MINDTEIDIDAGVAIGNAKLQTEVREVTKTCLRLESIRRKMTMGQLIDWIVATFPIDGVPKITS
ncbi:hypothetical protein QUB75_19725 [Microcoleus sp. K1-B6]|uniref:hypothetical protein n=1 Tax=Microcoleus sp. K1-B6 TaxID=2818787 RepID=UPI002FD7CB3C